jgi:hypothetical protein
MSDLHKFPVNPAQKPEEEEQLANNSDENNKPTWNFCHALNFVLRRNIRLMLGDSVNLSGN